MIRFNFSTPNRTVRPETKSKPGKYMLVETQNTPSVFLSATSHSMLIKGPCSPLDSDDFFARVNQLLDSFQQNGHQLKNATFHLSHIDSNSSRHILRLLQKMQPHDSTQTRIDITWFYDLENPDVLLAGKNIAEYSRCHMNFISFN